MKRLPSAILIFAIVFATYAAITHKTTVKPQAAKPVVKLAVALEAPPKTIQSKVIAKFEARQQARDKVLAETFRKAYVEPKNTPENHCLLVPHQVLDDQKATTATVKTHSVLVPKATCSREQHDSGTSPQNRNFNLRGVVPHFGGFHF